MDSKNSQESYSADDELYQTFGRGFVSALHTGIQIGMGKKQGIPARPWIEQLKKETEELKANEAN